MKPNSFCTMCTKRYKEELLCLLLTLSLYHRNESIYILCDKETKEYIKNISPKPKLKMKWYPTLTRYSLLKRSDMEKMGIWCDFQLNKMDIIKHAIEKEGDTLYLDSDMIILDEINDIDKDKELGLSPQYLQNEIMEEIGYYNGGMCWCNNTKIIDDWIFFTQNSRYYDQASLDDVYDIYKEKTFFFDDNYNFQESRFDKGISSAGEIMKNIFVKNNKLMYKDKFLKNIHLRFDNEIDNVRQLFLLRLKEANLYKELLCIFRLINKKWLISLPVDKEKKRGFRELAFLLNKNNRDLSVKFMDGTKHIWLQPDILIYDKPGLEWCNSEVATSSLILLGNCSTKREGKALKDIGLNVNNINFWPQHPMILERFMENNIKKYDERQNKILYIGNMNLLPNKRGNEKWRYIIDKNINNDHLDCKKCLKDIVNSKFAICVNNHQTKSMMMLDMMALGTVPITTKNVDTDNYISPLKEGVHYINALTIKQLKKKLKGIDEVKWREMSESCKTWYKNNIHSENYWNVLINDVLYS
jgi:hypothetical protein